MSVHPECVRRGHDLDPASQRCRRCGITATQLVRQGLSTAEMQKADISFASLVLFRLQLPLPKMANQEKEEQVWADMVRAKREAMTACKRGLHRWDPRGFCERCGAIYDASKVEMKWGGDPPPPKSSEKQREEPKPEAKKMIRKMRRDV